MRTRNILKSLMAISAIAIIAVGFTSCDDGLDVQQAFPFTVETMPVPNKVIKGETVEIRCELVSDGRTDNTLYTIRYFQFEGEGSLKMDNGIAFLPNDRYLLENEKFRLYYTSACDEAQNFIVVIEDNYGQAFEMEFNFNNDNKQGDGQTDVVDSLPPTDDTTPINK